MCPFSVFRNQFFWLCSHSHLLSFPFEIIEGCELKCSGRRVDYSQPFKWQVLSISTIPKMPPVFFHYLRVSRPLRALKQGCIGALQSQREHAVFLKKKWISRILFPNRNPWFASATFHTSTAALQNKTMRFKISCNNEQQNHINQKKLKINDNRFATGTG